MGNSNTSPSPDTLKSFGFVLPEFEDNHIDRSLSREDLFKKKILFKRMTEISFHNQWGSSYFKKELPTAKIAAERKEIILHKQKRSPFLSHVCILFHENLGKLIKDKKFVKSLKIVKHLECIFAYTTPKPTTHAISILKQMSKIETLTLRLDTVIRGEFPNQILHILSKTIQTLKCLKSFRIISNNFFLVDPLKLSFRWPKLEQCKNLQEIFLDFKENSLISADKDIQVLLQRLQKLSSLKKLAIHIGKESRRSKMKDSEFSLLFKGLRQLTTIHELSLELTHCQQFTKNSQNLFCSFLQSQNSLQKLNLKFIACEILTDSNLKKLDLVLKNCPLLTSLSLDFGTNSYLTTCGVNLFIKELQNISALSDLAIVVQRIDNTGPNFFQNLSSELTHHPHLNSLKLHIGPSWRISTNDLIVLSKSLDELSSLHFLDLHLSLGDFEDTVIESLCFSLQKLSNMKNLSLRFDGENKLTDGRLIILSSTLSSFKHLKALNLFFQSSKKISVKGIKALSASLQNLQTLREFNLFTGVCVVKDDSLNVLLIGIAHLRLLSTLGLCFLRKKQITDDELKLVVEVLKSLKYLNTLTIILPFPQQIDILRNVLNRAQFLKRVLPVLKAKVDSEEM